MKSADYTHTSMRSEAMARQFQPFTQKPAFGLIKIKPWGKKALNTERACQGLTVRAAGRAKKIKAGRFDGAVMAQMASNPIESWLRAATYTL
jgi:hypothetical protein